MLSTHRWGPSASAKPSPPQLTRPAPSKLLNSSGQDLQAFLWEAPNLPSLSQTFSFSLLGAKMGETEGWTRDGSGGKPPALFGAGEASPLSPCTLGWEMAGAGWDLCRGRSVGQPPTLWHFQPLEGGPRPAPTPGAPQPLSESRRGQQQGTQPCPPTGCWHGRDTPAPAASPRPSRAPSAGETEARSAAAQPGPERVRLTSPGSALGGEEEQEAPQEEGEGTRPGKHRSPVPVPWGFGPGARCAADVPVCAEGFAPAAGARRCRGLGSGLGSPGGRCRCPGVPDRGCGCSGWRCRQRPVPVPGMPVPVVPVGSRCRSRWCRCRWCRWCWCRCRCRWCPVMPVPMPGGAGAGARRGLSRSDQRRLLWGELRSCLLVLKAEMEAGGGTRRVGILIFFYYYCYIPTFLGGVLGNSSAAGGRRQGGREVVREPRG